MKWSCANCGSFNNSEDDEVMMLDDDGNETDEIVCLKISCDDCEYYWEEDV